MLPNHSPLAIAEQFGTLATLHPGPDRPRARPGAGQRPQATMRAMRTGTTVVVRSLPRRRPRPPGVSSPGAPRIAGVVGRSGRRHERPALHPRIVAVRRPAGSGSSVCPMPSRRTSLPAASPRCGRALYRTHFEPSDAARPSRTSWRASTWSCAADRRRGGPSNSMAVAAPPDRAVRHPSDGTLTDDEADQLCSPRPKDARSHR